MKPTHYLPPFRRFLAIRVFPFVLMLIAAGAVAAGIERVRLARASVNWPVVEGEVVRSGIEVESSSSGTGSRSVSHRPVVIYRYQVAGTAYEGRLVSYGESATSDVDDARKVLAKYPLGRRVPERYQPDAPAVAVLEPGGGGIPWFFAALGSAFLLVGVLLAWVMPKLVAPLPESSL